MRWYLITALAGAPVSAAVCALVGGNRLSVIASAVTGAFLAMIVIGPAARGSFRGEASGRQIPLSPRARTVWAILGVLALIATGLLFSTYHEH